MAAASVPRSTVSLYHEDAYLRDFSATVLSVEGSKIILDRTAFYPQGGGVPGDFGVLGGQRVINTKWEDETKHNIVHFLEGSANFKEGDKVAGTIDWERRYRLMRAHSADHIKEYFLQKVFEGLEVISYGLNIKGDETYDSSIYKHPLLDPEKFAEVERRVNDFIKQNLPIFILDDPKKPGYWVWKCGEIQVGCGSPAPRNTNELGVVKITQKNEKGNVKVRTFVPPVIAK